MTTTRTALTASVAALLSWLADAVAIGLHSSLDFALFLLGGVCFAVAVVSLGLAVTSGRRPAVRATGAVTAVVGAAVAGLLVNAAITRLAPARAGWVWGEVNLWVLGLAVTAVAALVARRRRA